MVGRSEAGHVIHRPGHEADHHLQSANHVFPPIQQAGHVIHRLTIGSKYSSQGLPQQLSNLQIGHALKINTLINEGNMQ